MFTGIIEDLGTVRSSEPREAGSLKLVFETRFARESKLKLGDSIAVDGCCLTASRLLADAVEADLSAETLARTTLGSLRAGSRVNLELALPAGKPMGGHIVQGHVDCVGQVASSVVRGDTRIVGFSAGPSLRPFLAEKGSIAVNGVSLTVNRLVADGFEVTLVPFTLTHTNLGNLSAGDAVNLEADVIAKYVASAVEVLIRKA